MIRKQKESNRRQRGQRFHKQFNKNGILMHNDRPSHFNFRPEREED